MTTTLPGPLRVRSHVPLVGREPELAALRAGLPGAEATLSAVLLAGEPGSGKSRLVRELAVRAAEGGVRVIYGACDSEVAAPYGPFAQALGQLSEGGDGPLGGPSRARRRSARARPAAVPAIRTPNGCACTARRRPRSRAPPRAHR